MKQGIINTDRRFYFRLAFFSCPLNSPLSHVFLVYRDVVIDDVYDDLFFSYLTDFSYFPLKIVFRKLLDTVRTGKK